MKKASKPAGLFLVTVLVTSADKVTQRRFAIRAPEFRLSNVEIARQVDEVLKRKLGEFMEIRFIDLIAEVEFIT